MKKIYALVLLAAFVFIGCKEKPKDVIVNKWKISDMTMPGQVMPDSIKQQLSKGTMEFTKDGKLLLTGIGMGGDQTGTYSLSEDGKTLTVTTNGKTEVSDVKELSKSKMVINDKASGSTLTAVPK